VNSALAPASSARAPQIKADERANHAPVRYSATADATGEVGETEVDTLNNAKVSGPRVSAARAFQESAAMFADFSGLVSKDGVRRISARDV